MEKSMVVTKNDTQALADDLQSLREKLENETNIATRLREAYGAECRQLARGEDANVIASKQKLDLVISRIDGIKAEIAEKERLLDKIQGREAEENRRKQVQQDFERAKEQLTSSEARLARLNGEYSVLVTETQQAEWRFHQALRVYNDAKSRLAEVSSK